MNIPMNRKKHSLLKSIIISTLIVLIVGCIFVLQKNPAANIPSKQVSFLFVGDIMLSRQIGRIMYEEQDPLYYFLRLKDVTSRPDITFGNLETSVSTRGENVGSIYSFRSHPDFLKGPLYGGFDVLSIANNHTFDWGPTAFLDTISHVRNNGMFPVGGGATISEARLPTIIEKNGVKVAFLAYSQFANKNPNNTIPAIAPLNREWMKEDVVRANTQADIVIVSLHWGDEYETNASDFQKTIAHELIDTGARMVIGHHPHVIQQVESYHGGLIAYSLGNFVFDQNFSEDTRKGMMLFVTATPEKVEEHNSTIVRFTDRFQPYIPE